MKINRKFLALTFVVAIIAGTAYLSRQIIHTPRHESQKSVYYCPMHPTYTSDRLGDCPICNMKLVKKEDEKDEHAGHMHHGPQERTQPRELTMKELMSMKPGEICLLHKCKMGQCMIAMTEEMARLGKCPHCQEDLGVIIKEDLPEGYSAVSLAADKQKVIGVRTGRAERIMLEKTIRAVGIVAHDPELYQAQAELLQAQKAFERAKSGGILEVSDQAEKLVHSNRVRLKSLGLVEPFIEEISRQAAADESLLYALAEQPVWIYAKVYEYELPFVSAGQEVQVEIPAISEENFKGTVHAVDTLIDPVTRTTRVRIKIPNRGGVFKSNMYVNVILRAALGDVLAIPREAVFDTGIRQIVFVDKEGGVFEPRSVIIGARGEHHYEIKSGISENEKVVISGNFLIDSESRLKAALQTAAGGHQH